MEHGQVTFEKESGIEYIDKRLEGDDDGPHSTYEVCVYAKMPRAAPGADERNQVSWVYTQRRTARQSTRISRRPDLPPD